MSPQGLGQCRILARKLGVSSDLAKLKERVENIKAPESTGSWTCFARAAASRLLLTLQMARSSNVLYAQA